MKWEDNKECKYNKKTDIGTRTFIECCTYNGRNEECNSDNCPILHPDKVELEAKK